MNPDSISAQVPDIADGVRMDRPISPPMSSAHTTMKSRMTSSDTSKALSVQHLTSKPNQVGSVMLYGVPIVSLIIESSERLCLAQISNTLLKQFSYNEIHNRRVALGITCVQCTPVQLEILRRAGAMPVSSRRCGMITRREAERLCKSFLGDNAPPRLPDDFAFAVHHECAWGCRGAFLPSRYNSSRAKCIKCSYCGLFFSPNKFIFHSHRAAPGDRYVQPDAANFNSWRRHMKLSGSPPDEVVHAWEDVKAMFNGGTRKRMLSGTAPSPAPSRVDRSPPKQKVARESSPSAPPFAAPPRAGAPFELPLPLPGSLSVMDYVWQQTRQRPRPGPFSVLPMPPYTLPWLKRPPLLLHAHAQMSQVHAHAQSSAFRPVRALRFPPPRASCSPASPTSLPDTDDDEQVDVEHVPADDDMRHERGRDHERARDPWKRAANYDEEGYSTQSETSDVIRSPFTPQPMAAGGPDLSPLLLKVENEEATNEGAITDSSITPEARPYYDPPLKHSIRELTSDTTRYRPPSPLSMYHPRNEPDSYIYANQQRRDALWSVARLSLEYADREKFADIYRPEISRPYAHNKDLDHQSPCSSTPLDCSACHPPPPPPPAPAPATS